MGELTQTCPKPLIKANNKALIVYNLEKLAVANIEHIVINTAYLGAKIQQYLGDGRSWNLHISYSHEGEQGLETAGGIIKALPKLLANNKSASFIAINADIYSDFNFATIATSGAKLLPKKSLAHLIMCPNPRHRAQGDFAIGSDNLLCAAGEQLYTFSGIGAYHADFFAGFSAVKRPLRQLFELYIAKQKISAELYTGWWLDVGTKGRLQQLEQYLLNQARLTQTKHI